MIRKSVLLAITVATLIGVCHAQDAEVNFAAQLEVLRADVQADRVSIVTAGMNLSDKDAAVFWPIYRQYHYERSKLEDSRVAVIKEYAQNYTNLSDAEAKRMAERLFEYDSHLAALRKVYFKKFNKMLPALTVAKFFQLDRRIDLLIDMKLASSLPPLTMQTEIKQQEQKSVPVIAGDQQ